MDRDSENFMKESIAFKQIEKRNTPITEIQCAGTKGEKKRGQQFYNAKYIYRKNGHILK